MNVLSLFDGMSCGQISLNRISISYEKYFASEINNHSIAVTQKNYPDTIQLGNVESVTKSMFINHEIDLLLGGSPCQDLTRTKPNAAGLKGNNSQLFWEYVRILKEINPKYFLLENVEMKPQWEDIITNELRVSPVKINSRLFSAQNRPRVYWTNIPLAPPSIKDQIKLIDILETNVPEKYFLNKSQLQKLNLNFNWNKSPSGIIRHVAGERQQHRIYHYTGIMACLNGGSRGSSPHLTKIYCKDGRIRVLMPIEYERLQNIPDNYTNSMSDMHRYEMIGNGWTIDVISHLFSGLTNNNK